MKNNNNVIDVSKIKATVKSLKFDEEDVEDYEYLVYGTDRQKLFLIFFLLYDHLDFKNHFHIDHILPKRGFRILNLQELKLTEKKINKYEEWVNYLANLQLLKGEVNEEKGSMTLSEWLKSINKNEKKWKKKIISQ